MFEVKKIHRNSTLNFKIFVLHQDMISTVVVLSMARLLANEQFRI